MRLIKKLLIYKNDRRTLIEKIKNVSNIEIYNKDTKSNTNS